MPRRFVVPQRFATDAATRDGSDLERPAPDQSLVGLDDDSGRESTKIVDFAFLATQTFGDAALEREVLELFVAQARRLIPTLPQISLRQQADTAHLLKGSARGIGAWAAAEAAAAYEAAAITQRPQAYVALVDAFAAAESVIASKL